MQGLDKQAGIGSFLQKILKSPWTHTVGGGVVNATMWDATNSVQKGDLPVVGTVKALMDDNVPNTRKVNIGIDTGLGMLASGLGSHAIRNQNAVTAGLAVPAFLGTPSKNLVMTSTEAIPHILRNTQDIADSVKRESNAALWKNILLGTLGIGALGVGGAALYRYFTKKEKDEVGKVKVKLPGPKDDPDAAMDIELPADIPDLAPTVVQRLNTAMKRQTKKNILANSMKVDPETGKRIPYEDWQAKYGDEEDKELDNMFQTPTKNPSYSWDMPKAASMSTLLEYLPEYAMLKLAAMAPPMPSPPQQPPAITQRATQPVDPRKTAPAVGLPPMPNTEETATNIQASIARFLNSQAPTTIPA